MRAPVVALALTAALLPGCPRAPGDVASGAVTTAGACRVRVEDTAFTVVPPEPMPTPRSRIGVEVNASLAALERELAKQVPVTLATERHRSVGTAGEVSYVVRRGRFGVALDISRLTVKVPVEVEAEVCKPLGPFCPTYGRCSPRLMALASVPLLLSDSYEIGKSRVSISVHRPCIIGGYDATPQIKSQAANQVGQVQSRIDAAMPDLRPSVNSVWELLHHPIALGSSTCLRIEPDRVTQNRPVLKDGALITELGAEGTLRIEDPCEPNVAVKPGPLPRLVTSEAAATGVELRVAVRTSWLDVSAELTRSLTKKGASEAETRVVKVEAEGTQLGPRALVVMRATLAGATCGNLRLLAEPWFDGEAGRLRLRRIVLAPGAPEVPGFAALAASIEQHASAALPVDLSAGPAALTALVQGFGRDLPGGAEIDAKIAKSAVARVHPEREGLVALAVFSGHTTFRLR